MTQVMTHQARLFLTGLVSINVLSLIFFVNPWISVITIVLLVWGFLHVLKGFQLPSRWILFGAGVLGTSIVVMTRRTVVGMDAASELLIVFSGLKLLETRRYRDAMVTIFLCLFLLTAHLLKSQSLASFAFFVIDLILITQMMLVLHPAKGFLISLKEVAKILVLVLPMWVALFTFFPRFGIGFSYREKPATKTGFSDEMNPGDVQQLVMTDQVAFRAELSTPNILSKELYWRGLILPVADGLRWMKGNDHLLSTENFEAKAAPVSEAVQYQVWLEPLFKKWLFSLDFLDPTEKTWLIPGNRVLKRAGLVRMLTHEATTKITYQGTARTSIPLQPLNPREQKIYLQLPKVIEPRVQKLADELRDKTAQNSMQNLVAWFKSQKFKYTLAPSAEQKGEQNEPLSHFLFESKKGFCEHYAAAGATLLRAMGIPARVIVGFQGGEKNELGSYWIIRNQNAHAWTEAWLSDLNQWVRFDLVAIVAPIRMQMGSSFFRIGEAALAKAESSSDSLFEFEENWASRMQNQSRLYWDAVEMQWGRFMLYYDFDLQQQLFSRIGIQSLTRTSLFIGVGVIILLIMIVIAWRLQRKNQVRDPEFLLWKRFLKKMEQRGFAKRTSEGPFDFTSRVSSALPVHAESIKQFGDIYVELRYAALSRSSFSKKLAQLKMQLKKIYRVLG